MQINFTGFFAFLLLWFLKGNQHFKKREVFIIKKEEIFGWFFLSSFCFFYFDKIHKRQVVALIKFFH